MQLGAQLEVDQLIADAHHTLELDLSGRQLDTVPDTVAACASLQCLALSANCLSYIPTNCCSLQQLVTLDLSYNQLSQLPPQIAALTCLEVLSVGYNHLTQLPAEMCHLQALQELRLNDNQLTRLPDGLSQLSKLQLLHLQYNHLTHLPAGLQNLSSLTDLDVQGNPLRPDSPQSAATVEASSTNDCRRPSSATREACKPDATSQQHHQHHLQEACQAQPICRHGQQHARHHQQDKQPDVLVLDAACHSSQPQPAPSPSGSRRAGGGPHIPADDSIDLDEPGINIVGSDPSRCAGDEAVAVDGEEEDAAGTGGLGGAMAVEELSELPPACAAVLYRSWDHVQAGLWEVQTGRPLTRGGTAGTAGGGSSGLPGTAGRESVVTVGGDRRGQLGSRSGRRPGTAGARPGTAGASQQAVHSGAGRLDGRAGAGQQGVSSHWASSAVGGAAGALGLSGVAALLAGPPRPSTASARGGSRPGTAISTPVPITAGGAHTTGRPTGAPGEVGVAGVAAPVVPAMTFPLASGLRSMMRQLSAGKGAVSVGSHGTGSASHLPHNHSVSSARRAAAEAEGTQAAVHMGDNCYVETEDVAGVALTSSSREAGLYSKQSGLTARPGDEATAGQVESGIDPLETVRMLLAARKPGLLQELDEVLEGHECGE